MLLLDLFYDNRVKFCLLTIEYNEGYESTFHATIINYIQFF